MGIAERRATTEFQTNALPGLRAEIHKLLGFDVRLEVAWDQLEKVGAAARFDQNLRKVFFQPLLAALRLLARDELGKTAVVAGLKQITICNRSGRYNADTAITFGQGELVLDHDPFSNVDKIEERTRAIQRVLEAGL